MRLRLQFEPHDLWIGVYWTGDYSVRARERGRMWRFYVCLVPTLPIIVEWWRPFPE